MCEYVFLTLMSVCLFSVLLLLILFYYYLYRVLLMWEMWDVVYLLLVFF